MVAIKDRALDMHGGTGNLSLTAWETGKLALSPAKLGGEWHAPRFQAGLGAYPRQSAHLEMPGQASGYSLRLAPKTIQQQSGFLEHTALKTRSTQPQAYPDRLQLFASSTVQQTL
jgi:hypothetical protein